MRHVGLLVSGIGAESSKMLVVTCYCSPDLAVTVCPIPQGMLGIVMNGFAADSSGVHPASSMLP